MAKHRSPPTGRLRAQRETARTDRRLQEAVALHQQGRVAEAATIYREVLEQRPDDFEALRLLGILCAQHERIEEAIHLFSRAANVRPNVASVAANVGTALSQLGRNDEALPWFDRAIALDAGQADVFFGRGNALIALGRTRDAIASFDRAVALNPNDAESHSNRGGALLELGEPEAARRACEQALAVRPDHVDAMVNLGAALIELSLPREALEIADRALVLQPELAEGLHNRGNALQALKRNDEALAMFDRVLALQPDHVDAMLGRASVLLVRGQLDEAMHLCDAVLAMRAAHPEALNNRGGVLLRLFRFEEALACFDRAIALKPDFVVALTNGGMALSSLDRFSDALAYFDRALDRNPRYARASRHRGIALRALRRYEDAAEAFRLTLTCDPEYEYAKGELLDCLLFCCDWSGSEALAAAVVADVSAGKLADSPFSILSISADPALHLQCARATVAEALSTIGRLEAVLPRSSNAKVRVAYISPDFREHPVTHLSTQLIELHDRARFEIVGVALQPWGRNPVGQRIFNAFDRVIEATRMSDRELVQTLREMEIDIAVDIAGFTTNSRPLIYPSRVAPIQVNYLGFPGTLGADYVDYLVTDRTVVPETQHMHYAERIVYLPDSFMPRDTTLSPGPTPTRESVGLPENGFVFCSFNNPYKLNPETFGIWMRLLTKVPQSVLWLSQQNELSIRNLRHEAERLGVPAERLVFATRTDRVADHLARYRLADLFLDTLPYNAHTTASDALWAGLPVLTRLGEAFAGRVAASLLHAIGLPELVTTSAEAYEALALELATNPTRMAALRAKLAQNRTTFPLFDADRYRRNLEAAYLEMVDRRRRGEAPASFSVPLEA